MMFLALFEATLIILFVWFLLSQFVFPIINRMPVLPAFRRNKIKKLLAELERAEQRRYELNLEAQKHRAERLIKAQEAAIPAAPSEGETK